jgi:catechol 2,3-dioxygenase
MRVRYGGAMRSSEDPDRPATSDASGASGTSGVDPNGVPDGPRGAAPAERASLPASTHIGRVFLRCQDLSRCVAFYRDALGLEVLERSAELAFLGAGGRALLGLISAPDARAAGRAPGLYHVALLLPDRASLGAFLAHAVRSRLALQGASDHGVSEAIYLADPEGNGIEVYRDRPREAWPRRGERVAMGTGPIDGEGLLAEAGQAGPFRAPAGTLVGHVHLRVADAAAAAARYRDDLGMDVTQADFPGARFLSAGGYHHHLGVNEWETRGAPARQPETLGLAWFEVVVPDDGARAAAEVRLRGAWEEREHLLAKAGGAPSAGPATTGAGTGAASATAGDEPGAGTPTLFVDVDGIGLTLVGEGP